MGRIGRHAIDSVRGDERCVGCDRRSDLVHRQADAGALGRDAACGILMRHRGRDGFGIAAEMAGIDDKAKAQAFCAAQVNDGGTELCSITQSQRHGVAKRHRTADRAADGDRRRPVDGGDEAYRIDGNMRRGRVRTHGNGRTADAVAAAIRIAAAEHRTDRLARQYRARNRHAKDAAAHGCAVAVQGSATAHTDDDGVAVVHLAADRAADLDVLARLDIVNDVVKRYGVKGNANHRLVQGDLNCRSGRAGAACRILCMDRGGHAAVINGAGCNRYAVAAIAGNRYVLCQNHAVGRDADRLARHRRIHLAAQRGLRRLGHHAIHRARGDDRIGRRDGRAKLLHQVRHGGSWRAVAA